MNHRHTISYWCISLCVIVQFLLCQESNGARIPLQVDITKMVQCDDSKRAANGDKVDNISFTQISGNS